MPENKEKNTEIRPPIVVIMGHVDHGKTSLLDYIRKTNIANKEAGGITQSIGAYEIEHNKKRITFIDTPGHEVFSKMRARGAKVADLAILVVAADNGVKPQTKESIKTLNAANTPFIVAINKIDKPGTDIEKTKQDLTANGVLLEGFGGNVPWQAISAKTGQGVDELLDLILLSAEMENLIYNPSEKVCGVIIETETNPRKGNIAAAIVKNGTLKTGDYIATRSARGKIKLLENFSGEKVKFLSPSAPAIILGFETLPQIGEEFIAGKDIPQISANQPLISKIKNETAENHKNAKNTFNLVIKADASGPLETLSEIIKNLKSESVKINILNESIGEITDGDIKTAVAGKAIIIGFGVKINKIAANLAKIQEIKIIVSNIIYELIEAVENEIKLLEKPKPFGELEILKIFSRKNKEQLVGGRAVDGIIKNNSHFKILRQNEEIGTGKVIGLRQHKQEINQAAAGQECGLFIESNTLIAEGDQLIWSKE